MKTIMFEGHKIEIPGMSLTGKEEIRYDGRVVSSKHSIMGAMHVFSVQENDEDVQYDVEVGIRWHLCSTWAILRRNGKIIYSNK